MTNTVHPFERVGLGRAPFRFIGMEDQDIAYGQRVIAGRDTGMLVTTQPGGTCAYCGQYILNMYNIKSADGRRFHVGSECVNKTGDKGLATAVNKAKREHDRKARNARLDVKWTEARAWLAQPAVRFALALMPHPQAWRAEKGETHLDMVRWYCAHAGKTTEVAIINAARKLFATA